MGEPNSSNTPNVDRQDRMTFRESWENDCRNFWIWAHCNNGHFTEVMLICWTFVIGFFMTVMAVSSGADAPNLITYWTLAAILLAVTGILGIHIVVR